MSVQASALEEVEARRRYIGGTDIAAILGLHPRSTPYQVWCEKKGLAHRELTEAMVHGSNLESYVARLFAAVEQVKLKKADRLFDPLVSHFAASPDYEVPGRRWYLECKTTGVFAAKCFGPQPDAVPEEYVCQGQWQLGIPRPDGEVYEAVAFAVLIGGQEYRSYVVERDDELIYELRRRADEWWRRHILGDEPPAVTERPCDAELLGKRFPNTDGNVVTATPDIEEAIAELANLKVEIKDLEAKAALLTNRIKAFMGEAAICISAAGEARWIASSNGVRRFTLHEPREGG